MTTPASIPVSSTAPRRGVWLIGARGSVATTVTVGLHALALRLVEPTGIATAGPAFAGLDLVDFGDIVIGGHDISTVSLTKRAEELAAGGLFPAPLLGALAPQLEETERQLRPAPERRRSQEEEIEAAADDIRDFRRRHDLASVVVVDVSSTEPLPTDRPEFHDAQALLQALSTETDVLPASAAAALTAARVGADYLCFTPSVSLRVPAVRELVDAAGIAYAGQDGKTGETLLRAVLAPLFSARAWTVHSWAGTNLLGGGDGATLADSRAVASKLASKNRGLHDLLGDQVVTPLHIDNVPDMGDVKTAWDHVHATAFLGSRITLQTTWSAHDSALAAPLVIDLIRLITVARDRGQTGAVAALSCFFKDPWGSDRHAFADQYRDLLTWVDGDHGSTP